MSDKNVDLSAAFPKRPKNAKLDGRTFCPSSGCHDVVRYSHEHDDPDEAIAAHCALFCERKDDKWINDPRCYAKAYIAEVRKPSTKKKTKKKTNNKKRGFRSPNGRK